MDLPNFGSPNPAVELDVPGAGVTEADYISAINEDAATDPERKDRLQEYAYADWLDEQGDPRGRGWRNLIRAGKRPDLKYGEFDWWEEVGPIYAILGECGLIAHKGDEVYEDWYDGHPTYFSAMNAAAIAWVRHHVDQNFLQEIEGP